MFTAESYAVFGLPGSIASLRFGLFSDLYLVNTLSMKQSDLYYFDTIQMTSQA